MAIQLKEKTAVFASDNAAGEDPRIFEYRRTINDGAILGYGCDTITSQAKEIFRKQFGIRSDPLFTFGGTGANIIALAPFVKHYQAVICADKAHIYVDECGGPEKFMGAKLLPIASDGGKIRPEQIEEVLGVTQGIVHRVQPSIVSITQPTEAGTVYTPDELIALVACAHRHGLAVHIDGARLSNAAAALQLDLKELTFDLDVDVVTFGGTKIGLGCGEAILFKDAAKADEAAYIQKQMGQLPSKMRLVAGPLGYLLESGIWLENARYANAMALRLAEGLEKVTQKVETNAVFISVSDEQVKTLKERFDFVLWNPKINECRFMTSFITTDEDIEYLRGYL